MKRTILVLALTLGLLLLALSGIHNRYGIAGLGGAAAQTHPPTDVYAVTFLCGNFSPVPKILQDGVEYPVKPGNYFTAINVHNPNWSPLSIQKKVVLLYRADKPSAPEKPMPPSALINAGLETDWGLEIDCSDIRDTLLGGAVSASTFIKGWVVIEVPAKSGQADPLQLDVTAVYTAHGWNQQSGKPVYEGFAEDMVQVLPKRAK